MAPHPAARLGLEAPADPAGRAHPGAGPGTGPDNRAGIEGALLGTGAPTRGHAPRLPAPAAPVSARAALDPAPDHRRGPAKHSGDARLTTQTPAPHRPQPGPTRSKADDNPHPPLNQENCLHPMTPPLPLAHNDRSTRHSKTSSDKACDMMCINLTTTRKRVYLERYYNVRSAKH